MAIAAMAPNGLGVSDEIDMIDVASQAYEDLFAALQESISAGEAILGVFRDAFLQSEQRDYVSRWQAGMSALDAYLGIPTPTFHRITDIFGFTQPRSAAAAAFTVEILSNTGSFRAAYNAALADYRRLRGMQGTRHPMPDLDARGERIELPFWLLNSCQVRRRLWVETQDDTIHAVLEVSSHSLDQHRVDGIGFAVAIFSNLTQDHLDYHGTMENYLVAKRRLFELLKPEAAAIVNADDPHANAMAQTTKARVVRFGLHQPADVQAKITRADLSGSRFTITGERMASRRPDP